MLLKLVLIGVSIICPEKGMTVPTKYILFLTTQVVYR